MSANALHEFGIFSLDDACVVVIYLAGQTPERLPKPSMPRVAAVACSPEVEELLDCVDLQLPFHVCLTDVYAGIRAAFVAGWNEGARPLGKSITVEQFAVALQLNAPWEIQRSLKQFIDHHFPWVFRLSDQLSGHDPVAWQDMQALLAGAFQLAFVFGLRGVL